MFTLLQFPIGSESIRGWSGATFKDGDLHPKPTPIEPPVIKPKDTEVVKPLPPRK